MKRRSYLRRLARALAACEYRLDDEMSESRCEEISSLAQSIELRMWVECQDNCTYPNLGHVGWDDEYVDYDEAREDMKYYLKAGKEDWLYELSQRRRKHSRKGSKKTA